MEIFRAGKKILFVFIVCTNASGAFAADKVSTEVEDLPPIEKSAQPVTKKEASDLKVKSTKEDFQNKIIDSPYRTATEELKAN